MEGSHVSYDRQVQDRARILNKRMLNPLAIRFAGRPFAPYGIVRHVGRQSGQQYDTPVLVRAVGDQFVVPLPYGTEVDWYRNVRAADECTVVYDGSAYRAELPRLVDPAAVPEAFPDWQEGLIRRVGANQFLRMDRGEEVPAVYREVTREYPTGPAVAGVAGAVVLAVGVWVLAAVARRAAKRDA